MDTLWAPWRMAYIEGAEKLPSVEVGEMADPHCFLCQGVYDTENDRARLILRRTNLTISLLNKFPYNNGHLLVSPHRHCSQLTDLSEAEQLELIQEINRWVKILEKAMKPSGFNVGLNLGSAAGAGLPGHIHWHIIPRWVGDTNFITSIGSTKVIPQSLEALWEILIDCAE